MTKRETYEKKTEEILNPMMEEHGFELVDVEYVKGSRTAGICGRISTKRAALRSMTVSLSAGHSVIFWIRMILLRMLISLKSALRVLAVPLKKEKDYVRSTGQKSGSPYLPCHRR